MWHQCYTFTGGSQNLAFSNHMCAQAHGTQCTHCLRIEECRMLLSNTGSRYVVWGRKDRRCHSPIRWILISSIDRFLFSKLGHHHWPSSLETKPHLLEPMKRNPSHLFFPHRTIASPFSLLSCFTTHHSEWGKWVHKERIRWLLKFQQNKDEPFLIKDLNHNCAKKGY